MNRHIHGMESERLYSSSGMNAEMARSVGFDWQLSLIIENYANHLFNAVISNSFRYLIVLIASLVL